MDDLRTDNLVIPQGTTWSCRWPLLTKDGDPLNVAGWSARAQVRRTIDSAAVLHEWTTADGNAVLADASVTLKVAADESPAWTWHGGPRVYDLEIVSPTGDVVRVTGGTVRLSREVTR